MRFLFFFFQKFPLPQALFMILSGLCRRHLEHARGAERGTSCEGGGYSMVTMADAYLVIQFHCAYGEFCVAAQISGLGTIIMRLD